MDDFILYISIHQVTTVTVVALAGHIIALPPRLEIQTQWAGIAKRKVSM